MLVIDGSSMEPSITSNDLVLVSKEKEYVVGAVAAYYNDDINRVVLHRIVDEKNGQFVFKGDNNSWQDPYRPESSEIVGKKWLQINGAGGVLKWVRQPLHAAVALGLTAFLALGGAEALRAAKRRNRPRYSGVLGTRRAWSMADPRALLVLSYICIAGVAVFALVAVLAYRADLIVEDHRPVSYSQEMRFDYTANATGNVYKDGVVRTGEPIFLNTVDTLQVRFVHRMVSSEPHNVLTTTNLMLHVADGEGWLREIQLHPEVSSAQDMVEVTGVVDIGELRRIQADFEETTGVNRGGLRVSVVAGLEVSGEVAGQECCAGFEAPPSLDFLLKPMELRLYDGDSEVSSKEQIRRSETHTVDIVSQTPGTMHLLGAQLDTRQARLVGTAGLLICLAGTLLLLAIGDAAKPASSEAITARFGSAIVPVDLADSASSPVYRLRDIGALVDVGERLGLPVIHYAENGVDVYAVHDRTAVYQFVVEHRPNAPGGRQDAMAAGTA